MSARDRLIAIADWTQRVQLWVSVVALVILMMVTVLDVFLRYVFNHPIRASYDSVESLLLIFVFNSMAATFSGAATWSSTSLTALFRAARSAGSFAPPICSR
jgi:TRAP-type C4-dicarboxylate transport system permease small subunit